MKRLRCESTDTDEYEQWLNKRIVAKVRSFIGNNYDSQELSKPERKELQLGLEALLRAALDTKCPFCELRTLTITNGVKAQAVFDHIVAVSLGGTTTLGNIRVLCAECNRTKSNISAEAWKELSTLSVATRRSVNGIAIRQRMVYGMRKALKNRISKPIKSLEPLRGIHKRHE